MQKPVVVAIDGPAGAGKSTLSRKIAARLGYVYIDTGAMYRSVALAALRAGIETTDTGRLESIAQHSRIRFAEGNKVLLNGEDVTAEIRQPAISEASSRVSEVPGVRKAMVSEQRRIAASESVVMEGRDIGTVVFPNAEVKIFLDADPMVRAIRRCEELKAKGLPADVQAIADAIAERDRRDATRADSPMVQAEDAVRLDTSHLNMEQVEEAILQIVEAKLGKENGRLKNLLVMKFGGTSMGSADRMKTAARICMEQRAQRPVVCVVSAMSKITDLLLDSLRKAEAGDRTDLDANLKLLRERHEEAMRDLLPSEKQKEAAVELAELLSEFERITNGVLMLGERPPRAVDEAIAIGERLSSLLLASYLETQGVSAAAVNGADLIATDAVFGNASPLMELTRDRCHRLLHPMLGEGALPVVTGFNGSTADGRPTTLGRGGSDFSASILAAALDASELWIWTDVDGIMSADPRLVSDAKVLPEVTYGEAAELAYNGAKVLHPRTLAPLAERKIPVWSKNSFNLAAPGTKIVPELSDAAAGPRAVTSIKNVAMIAIEPATGGMSGTRLMARAVGALAGANVEILAITSSSYRQTFCFIVRQDELRVAMDHLEEGLALELTHGYAKPVDVDENVGLIAVVGEGMRGSQGLAGRIFSAISREQVNIIAIAQGSSESTIAIVVRREGLDKAVRAIHSECGMGR
jgi:bifunctional aspartokinase / homoserine dehydrogenase 1